MFTVTSDRVNELLSPLLRSWHASRVEPHRFVSPHLLVSPFGHQYPDCQPPDQYSECQSHDQYSDCQPPGAQGLVFRLLTSALVPVSTCIHVRSNRYKCSHLQVLVFALISISVRIPQEVVARITGVSVRSNNEIVVRFIGSSVRINNILVVGFIGSSVRICMQQQPGFMA